MWSRVGPRVSRSLAAFGLVLVIASPATHAVIIVSDGTTPSNRVIAQDPLTPGFGRVDFPSDDLAGTDRLVVDVADGRSSASTVWVNRQDELSITFDLRRAGDSPPASATANVDAFIQFRVDQPMRYELSVEMDVADTGQGDLGYIDVRFEERRSGGHLIQTLFKGHKRSLATPDEHFVFGLNGGDFIDEQEGSLTGVVLPVLPGDAIPDRRFQLVFDAALYDWRNDPGDTGSTASGAMVLKLTPFTPTPEPEIQVWKRDTLAIDDGDGRVEPGETLEYALVIENVGTADAEGVVFEDTLPSDTTLVRGSVQTSRGLVVSGNAAGDTDVEIDVGSLPPDDRVDVVFRAIVDDPFPVDVQELSNRGRVRGDNFPVSLSDDPDTSTRDDVTRTFVANTPLDRCEREVLAVQSDLFRCRATVSSILTDSDGDGVLDLVDRCPTTESDSEVDDRGCSRAEFCGEAGRSAQWLRALSCNLSDWKNDEPLWARDCRWTEGACLPQTDPPKQPEVPRPSGPDATEAPRSR